MEVQVTVTLSKIVKVETDKTDLSLSELSRLVEGQTDLPQDICTDWMLVDYLIEEYA